MMSHNHQHNYAVIFGGVRSYLNYIYIYIYIYYNYNYNIYIMYYIGLNLVNQSI